MSSCGEISKSLVILICSSLNILGIICIWEIVLNIDLCQGRRLRVSPIWLTRQMLAAARAGTGRRQQPGMELRLGHNLCSVSCCLAKDTLAGSWDWTESQDWGPCSPTWDDWSRQPRAKHPPHYDSFCPVVTHRNAIDHGRLWPVSWTEIDILRGFTFMACGVHVLRRHCPLPRQHLMPVPSLEANT